MDKPETTTDPMEEWALEIVFAWIKEDCPVGIQMMLMPEITHKLIKRIAENAS